MRSRPRLFQYDYLVLRHLATSLRQLVGKIPPGSAGSRALDLGSASSPYAEFLTLRGYEVKTLDIEGENADYTGTAADTGLPASSFDVVLCTQVLEHVPDPARAAAEIARILRPGGWAVISVPHVWFHHPHPADYWRMTEEGLRQICVHGALECHTVESQGNSITSLFQIICFLLYGVFGRFGAPLYAAINLLALVGERVTKNNLFCLNYACLARRLSASIRADASRD